MNFAERRVLWKPCLRSYPENSQIIQRNRNYESNIQDSSFGVVKSFLFTDCMVGIDSFFFMTAMNFTDVLWEYARSQEFRGGGLSDLSRTLFFDMTGRGLWPKVTNLLYMIMPY